MNDEKLIELVRQNTALYDFENNKYSDNNYKEKIWLTIAKEMNIVLGSTCKTRWNQLRDQWRKNKKNKVTKSGEANKPIKRWRYDEQMGFLEPFSRQRDTIGNLNDIPIDIEEAATHEYIIEIEQNAEVGTMTSTSSTSGNGIAEASSTCSKQQSVSTQKGNTNKNESASTVLMKYLIDKQKNEENHRPLADPTDKFFENIAAKVKRFTLYYKNMAETRIFNLVQQMELEQISTQQPHTPYQKIQVQQTQQNQVPDDHLSRHPPLSPSPSNSNFTAGSFLSTFSYDD